MQQVGVDCSLNDCNCEDGSGGSRYKHDNSDGDYTSVRLCFGNGDEKLVILFS